MPVQTVDAVPFSSVGPTVVPKRDHLPGCPQLDLNRAVFSLNQWSLTSLAFELPRLDFELVLRRLIESAREIGNLRQPNSHKVRSRLGKAVARLVGFPGETTVKEYRVTKYDPALRGPNGEYKGDDWTMFSQIGQKFRGVVLTEEEYKRVEDAYVKVAQTFLSESGVAAVRVVGLENSRRQLLEFNEGSVVPLEKLSEALRGIFRGEFWCRFQADDEFVHVGWDYYMYVGVRSRCPAAEQTATEVGLYVEEFVSPHHEETGN